MLEMLMSNGSNNIKEPLLAGTYAKGWYGEVSTSNFINGSALASAIGLSAGTAINSTAGWLKFSLDNKTLYVAKKPFRYGISWNSISAIGAVSGSKTITIAGKTYMVRLLKGVGDLTTSASSGYDNNYAFNSEWNQLLYHVSGKPFANANNTLASEGISVGDWAQYSEADLVTHSSYGNGSYSWCQESPGSTNKILRGLNGVSYIGWAASSTNGAANMGWRPCLELIG